MTVKTLIEKLSHYNKDAIVRLHHSVQNLKLLAINSFILLMMNQWKMFVR